MTFPGFLTDGHTAERRAIQVSLEVNELQLLDDQGMLIDEWSYVGLVFIDTLYRGQPVRLSHCDRREACLTVEDGRFFPLLRRAVPQFRGHQRVPRSTLARLYCWGVAVVVTVLGVVWEGPRLVDPVARAVPMRWEEVIGRQITEKFVQQTPECTGASGKVALQLLAERLTKTLPYSLPVKLQVRHSQVINAFALPGGYIVVFQGLVRAARSSEEMAGVLAHEMAHQIQRHPMRGLVRSIGLRMISGAMIGNFSVTATSGTYFGETLFSLSYNREDESEADRLGVEMLNKANIRGDGLVDFFTRYQGESEARPGSQSALDATQEHLMSLLSTHPSGPERITTIRSLVHGKGDALTKEQWKALQTICDESPIEN